MDQVAQIRDAVDIVSLISEYIQLKKLGRNFKATCPFHAEKTPSFVVSPERQIWHCFGCGKGGDVYAFLMEYEHLEFPEALRLLAKKTGVMLLQTPAYSQTASKKDKIYGINRLSAEFYHYLLTTHPAGKHARDYVAEKRQISGKIIETFLLGFAPPGNTLSAYLTQKKGYTKEDIIDAGLGYFRNGKVNDFFTNRLMFPLFDHMDNIVGFSGRLIDGLQTFGGKYVNTRETLVYHKGSHFFGLHSAKQEIKKQETAIIVEGEFDVISCFKEGITNVVAVKGTALTEEQVHLLSRFAKRVILCFDQDKAGREATRRSVPALEKNGMSVHVVVPADAKDPDEAIKENPLLFKKLLKQAVPLYDYFFDNAFVIYDRKTAEGKQQISSDLLSLFTHIENEIVKEHYFRKLSKELAISYESITRQAQKIAKQEVIPLVPLNEKKKKNRRELLEEYLVALIVQLEDPKPALRSILATLKDISFQDMAYKRVLDFLVTYIHTHDGFERAVFLTTLPQELLQAYDTCFLLPLPSIAGEKAYQREVKKVAFELHVLYLRDIIRQITESIQGLEEQGAGEKIEGMNKELTRRMQELKKIEQNIPLVNSYGVE